MKLSVLSIILSLMVFGCNTREQEIIIVPKDYKGYILIIFDRKEGKPVRYEGKKRIYEISESGILKTQFESNDGFRAFPEYYYERIAPENKLHSYAELEKVPTDRVVGCMGASGTVKKSSEGEERLEFSLFYIGTKSNIEQAKRETDRLNQLDILKLAE